MVHCTACSLYHQTTCSLLETDSYLFTLTVFLQLVQLIFFTCQVTKCLFQDLNHNGTLHSLQSLPLDHLLVVGNRQLLIHHINRFFQLVQQILDTFHVTNVGLEPQWYITQRVVFTNRDAQRNLDAQRNYGPLAQLIHLTPFLQLVQAYSRPCKSQNDFCST